MRGPVCEWWVRRELGCKCVDSKRMRQLHAVEGRVGERARVREDGREPWRKHEKRLQNVIDSKRG